MPVLKLGGMTVMPGLIDTHRHDLIADQRAPETDAELFEAIQTETPTLLEQLLREGFTTIMVPAFNLSALLEVRRRLENGLLRGPRVLFTGPAITAPGDHPTASVCGGRAFCSRSLAIEVENADQGRTAVRELTAASVDAIKVIVDRTNVPEVSLDFEIVAEVIDEAHSLGMPVMLHAERVEAMIEGAMLGVDRLVHTPNDALISNGEGGGLLRDFGIPISTTVSFSSPQFATVMAGIFRGDLEASSTRHEIILANVRYLWDQGVTVAFGTDSPPRIRPIVEVQQLSTRLTPEEVISALTRNAAMFLGLDDEIGTLQVGKVADMIVIEGDPLRDLTALSRVALVIQGGRVVVDAR